MSSNPNEIELLKKNIDKIVWDRLCVNVNLEAIELLKEKLKNYTAPKRSKKFYETHKKRRDDNPLRKRDFTYTHEQPDVPTVEKQLDSYQLPVLNADINSTFTTLPDDKQPIVDSLNNCKIKPLI